MNWMTVNAVLEETVRQEVPVQIEEGDFMKWARKNRGVHHRKIERMRLAYSHHGFEQVLRDYLQDQENGGQWPRTVVSVST